MLDWLQKFLRERIRKRRWSDKKQLAWIKQTIYDDNQWLSHDLVARSLTQRYLDMLSDSWETVSILQCSDLRTALQLDPNYTNNFVDKESK
jgi:hypothetical protein